MEVSAQENAESNRTPRPFFSSWQNLSHRPAADHVLHSQQGDATVKEWVPICGGEWRKVRWTYGDIWAININLYLSHWSISIVQTTQSTHCWPCAHFPCRTLEILVAWLELEGFLQAGTHGVIDHGVVILTIGAVVAACGQQAAVHLTCLQTFAARCRALAPRTDVVPGGGRSAQRH